MAANANVCISDVSHLEDMGHTFFFERDIHYASVNDFMTRHFPKVFVLVALYVAAIHAGQRFMRDRPPIRLRKALVLWNIALSIYSIFGFSRVFKEMSRVYLKHGFHAAICDLHDVDHANAMVTWCAILAASKVVELGDTVFVVARKAPLRFLHWFHHVATLLFVWYCVVLVNSLGRWFMVNNLFVHAIMYPYYALKVLGVGVPSAISMTITVLQLLQMLVGIAMTFYAYRTKAGGGLCCTDDRIIACAWAMYLAYFMLFLNFFAKSYFGKDSRSAKAQGPKKVQ